MTCGDANTLLNTKYNFYENEENGHTHLHVQDGVYNIPDSVFAHIDFISPTIRFPLKQHTLNVAALNPNDEATLLDPASDGMVEYNTPQRLAELYNFDLSCDDVSSTSSIRQSVASFDEEYYSDSDLLKFDESFYLCAAETERVPSDQPQGTGSEAELDTQYITVSCCMSVTDLII